MKHTITLLACLALVACSSPVVKSQKTTTVEGNSLQVVSGTANGGRFISVANSQKEWAGGLKGGKEQWNARRGVLLSTARTEMEQVCGDWFVALRKGPLYTMLDSDETMGGVAPALGVTVAMAAYIAAEAATKDTNIPSRIYMEFSCQGDEK